MATWILIVVILNTQPSAFTVPMQSEEACTKAMLETAKSRIGNPLATDARCINTRTGEIKG